MKSMFFKFLPVLLFCVAATQAQVAKPLTITISPFHLVAPIFEFTGEYALSPKFGAALIGGYGGLKIKNSLNNEVEIPVLEIGGQAAYYVLGSFRHGMQVGAELLWIKVSPPKDQGVTVAANGIAIGPMIGYKWVARFGLTLLAQGGYELLFAQAKARDVNGQELEASTDTGIPLVNLNIGWSF